MSALLSGLPGPAGVATHSPYCALQCGMLLRPLDGTVQVAARDFPTNRGGLCQQGWTAADLLTSPGRLSTPLAREHRQAQLRPVSWDDALDRIAGQLRRIREQYGPDAVGVFGLGGLTNEKAYVLGKFAGVALGTSQIDYNGRFCMSSAAAGASPRSHRRCTSRSLTCHRLVPRWWRERSCQCADLRRAGSGGGSSRCACWRSVQSNDDR